MIGTIAKIFGPTTWPISQDTAREFVIIDDADEDHMRVLDGAIRAATAWAEGHTGLTAQPQTLQLRLDGWPDDACGEIVIPAAPVRDVLTVTYVDEAGIEQTVTEGNYSWERTPEGALITFESDFSKPSLRSNRHGTVRVTFDAGFDDPDSSGSGDDPDLRLPDQLVMAVSQVVAQFYDNRQPNADGLRAAQLLLDQVRVYR
jgi:uncharacterized phiE125 gp8 family phage protein